MPRHLADSRAWRAAAALVLLVVTVWALGLYTATMRSNFSYQHSPGTHA